MPLLHCNKCNLDWANYSFCPNCGYKLMVVPRGSVLNGANASPNINTSGFPSFGGVRAVRISQSGAIGPGAVISGSISSGQCYTFFLSSGMIQSGNINNHGSFYSGFRPPGQVIIPPIVIPKHTDPIVPQQPKQIANPFFANDRGW